MKYIDDEFSFSELKRIIRKVFIFLVLIGFAVSCNFILFLSFAPMNEEAIREAAPITFVNVLFLTVLFTLIDEVRHFLMVTRPIKQIREGMNKIVEGDFHVRIPYVIGENSVNDFDAIIKGVNEMARELSGVETLRTDFISNVSHELKTPLAVIQNYGTMLQSPYISDEERNEYAVAITEQTRKLSNMITNILKLNRLENQQIYPEKKVYNISEQLCECLLMFEHAWEKKNIEIETEIEDDFMVFQDEELLSLVWNNLFSNAVKFTEDNGKISLCVKRDKDSIAVSISDSGCGISPEVGAHIFEKFYQGDTSHATQGNGLGLALVKRVIDIVGGDISVQSVLGEGTTFTVYLKEYK
ncbi:MAG: HAMP domain-containing histidine kinase [Erysipelotrichales bacterium]|nr:HAMP domain-containing histidine kinase [Erysipelotrichales bacterium]